MPKMTEPERLNKMYVKNDSLSTRVGLHDKYSVNPYGWGNWVFDQYAFRNGMTILELGCGTAWSWAGRGARLPKQSKIVLSDFSALMVEKAKGLLQDNPSFSFEQIDIQDIPYQSESFDAVIANHMLYHVPDMDKALSEVYRVLKKDGRFYTTTLGRNSLKELQDIYHKLKDKVSFSYSENITFTLENGAERLGRFFADIQQRQYIDSLQVTSIGDLMAYIKSYNDIPDAIDNELFQLLQSGFSSDGVFHITKEQGMFICKK
jgi:ubiquinone/menaquinone biosynthesis C-methylase UbiE